MQTSVPELTDLSKEPEHVFELYGADARKPGTFAANCLLARRLAERGVRFIQLFHRGWDQHTGLPQGLARQCHDTDQPSAALIQDLKERGLLDDTLVVWGGEFGRTVYCQGRLTETITDAYLHLLQRRRRLSQQSDRRARHRCAIGIEHRATGADRLQLSVRDADPANGRAGDCVGDDAPALSRALRRHAGGEEALSGIRRQTGRRSCGCVRDPAAPFAAPCRSSSSATRR